MEYVYLFGVCWAERNMSGRKEHSLSRRTVLKATGAGAVGAVAFTGTASANCPCEGVNLGKIEGGKLPSCPNETTTVTLTLDGDDRIADDPECQSDKDIDVQVTATECKGDEVTCVELKIVDDNCACKCADDGLYFHSARVKGGPTHADYVCDDVVDSNQEYSSIPDACAPVNESNGKRYGISHIDIDVCVFPNDKETGSDCANNGGVGC